MTVGEVEAFSGPPPAHCFLANWHLVSVKPFLSCQPLEHKEEHHARADPDGENRKSAQSLSGR